ncbi:MAG: DUF423 domain-containing protein [Pseudomonadota bacterium]
MILYKPFILIGSIAALLAVVFGAFGAHALKARVGADLLAVFQTGVQYHFYHALGLILVGILAASLPTAGWTRAAGWLMLAGIVIFSGSLYLLALTGQRWLGMITPIGGVAFIAAWATLAVAVVKSN